LTLGLSISFQSLLAAWIEPTAMPPGNNRGGFLDVSSTPQEKEGNLEVNGLGVNTNLFVSQWGVFDERVGIGTGVAAPQALLDINGASSLGTPEMIIREGTNNFALTLDNSGRLALTPTIGGVQRNNEQLAYSPNPNGWYAENRLFVGDMSNPDMGIDATDLATEHQLDQEGMMIRGRDASLQLFGDRESGNSARIRLVDLDVTTNRLVNQWVIVRKSINETDSRFRDALQFHFDVAGGADWDHNAYRRFVIFPDDTNAFGLTTQVSGRIGATRYCGVDGLSPTSPNSGCISVLSGNKVGAQEYCNPDGTVCKTVDQMGGGSNFLTSFPLTTTCVFEGATRTLNPNNVIVAGGKAAINYYWKYDWSHTHYVCYRYYYSDATWSTCLCQDNSEAR
jgi:hypothetical protein